MSRPTLPGEISGKDYGACREAAAEIRRVHPFVRGRARDLTADQAALRRDYLALALLADGDRFADPAELCAADRPGAGVGRAQARGRDCGRRGSGEGGGAGDGTGGEGEAEADNRALAAGGRAGRPALAVRTMKRLVYESVTQDDLQRLAAAVGQLAEAITRQLNSDVATMGSEWAGEPTDEKIKEELFDDFNWQFTLDWETALAWRDQLKFLAQRLRSLEPEPEPAPAEPKPPAWAT